MDLTPFKLDIDELINEFSETGSTTLADMKRIWLSRKFTYIYEGRPKTNLVFFMQSLYAHSIGKMVSTGSLSQRLGGMYCLYCLYETQPFKPPLKIYLSLGELKKLRNLVVDAKEANVRIVPALVKRMLEKHIFLFGFVDINEGSVAERVNEITNLQNARIRVAYEKLLSNTRIEHFLHMDLGMELDMEVLKRMSTEYAKAKELAIKEAGEQVDIENIKHIAENKTLIGDVIEKIAEDWNIQKEVFYQQSGFNQSSNIQEEDHVAGAAQEEENVADDFDKELEHLLLEQ
ncbi:PREDICTED: uncharacterized protein LOC104592497 isoform X2 [Nelumbo nucifera]|uniref:Uncharacterized protein LOC104592497 isoform X2 n=1 Tax=Nelumbo nucifera TaxID=4432 RepID=A0A1U7ZNM0_NELNU|nr:PREDICTED: uncharacterized protein LOC104592497 isoform X2 [Nelumbo nucifera]